MAGEEIAAAHADNGPHRDSMRIDKIAQFRYYKPGCYFMWISLALGEVTGEKYAVILQLSWEASLL
jgi:hypothetical protein